MSSAKDKDVEASELFSFTEEQLLVAIPTVAYIDHLGNRREANESPFLFNI